MVCCSLLPLARHALTLSTQAANRTTLAHGYLTGPPSTHTIPCASSSAPELRLDILERVLQPIFAAEPFGLIPQSPLSVTTYAKKTRYPAVLQVNQIIRAESIRVFLKLARAENAELDIEKKHLQEREKHLIEVIASYSGPDDYKRRVLSSLRGCITMIVADMAGLESACRVIGHDLKCW